MRLRTIGLLAAAIAVTAAPAIAEAQGQRQGRQDAPRAQRAMMAGGGSQGIGAEYFLARTAQLGLSDQQVVQLAAIARRAETRRQAARENATARVPGARMPGARMAPGARGMAPRSERGEQPDSATRAAVREARMEAMQRMRASMIEMREQREADLRDALAVLTPEQQATAWRSRGRR